MQTFDDEWCVVGRDRFGEVEVGAVPAYVFTKGEWLDIRGPGRWADFNSSQSGRTNATANAKHKSRRQGGDEQYTRSSLELT